MAVRSPAGLDEEPRDSGIVKAAAATARAAVREAVSDVTRDGHLADVDLLGHMYTVLHSGAAARGRGEVYTPATVHCYLMAKMLLGPDSPITGGGTWDLG